MRTSGRSSVGPRTLASLLATTALLVGVAEGGTLQDTIRATIANNPELGVVKADRHAVDQELRQARGGYLPSVDARGMFGPAYTKNDTTRSESNGASGTWNRSEAQIKLSQMLWDGHAVQSEVERQSARANSATYRVEESAEFLALGATEAHLEVLRHQEILRLNEANLEAHRRILRQVEELERGGGGDIADVQQTLSRLAEAEASLARARGALADAAASYQQIVGEPPQRLTLDPLPAADLPAAADAAALAASVESPTVRIAASDVDVAAAELRGTRANYYPRFDLELTGAAGNDLAGQDDSSYDASALLVLRYNLFRGGADIAREREAFHRVNEARSALEQARRRAEEEARLSFSALETAQARTVALRAKAEAQRRTRDAYAQQFEVGQRDLLDVLDAENELFLARVGLVTAEYTERFAVYRLLAVVGDLLAAVDVQGPREQTTIHRTPADVQSREAIEDKSQQLHDPRAEPRAVRGIDAGEPPADVRDLSTVPPGAGPAGAAPGEESPQPLSEAAPPAPSAAADAAAAGDDLSAMLDGLLAAPGPAPAIAPAAFAPDPEPAAPWPVDGATELTVDEFFAAVRKAFSAD
jgi:adhesin transport system outer membrane protein